MGETKHRAMSILRALALVLACLTLSVCGGEEVVQGMPGGGGARPAQTRTSARAQAPPSPQTGGIRQLEFEGEVRDPFMRYFPEEAEIIDLEPGTQPLLEMPEELGPLAEYSIDQLQLVGVISRSAEPRAMFRIPGSNQSVFARIDDRIGPNGTGRIADIQPNRVIVSYENILLTGEQAQTVDILLRDPRQQIEAEFDPY